MIRDKKGIDLFFLILLIFVVLILSTYKGFSKGFYIVDEANILSDEVISYLESINMELEEKLGVNILIRTYPGLDGADIENVAEELYRKIYKNPDNEILIILAPNENKSYIKLGPGLTNLFSDDQIKKIEYESIEKNFDLGLFDTAAVKGVNSIINPLLKKNGMKLETELELKEDMPAEGSSITWKFIAVIVGLIMIDLIVFDAQFINTISRAVVGFRGEYKGNMSPYRTSERFRGAGTGPRDDWPSDLEKENKYGNW